MGEGDGGVDEDDGVVGTTRKRAIDEIDTNGAPCMWCATAI